MDPVDLYLDLLKACLTRTLFMDEQPIGGHGTSERWKAWARRRLGRITRSHAQFFRSEVIDRRARIEGRDHPDTGETMIGMARLDNIQHCLESVLHDRVGGDLIEAGVWRGGASIMMKAVLAAHGVTDRTVWLADSFRGLPAPNADVYPCDRDYDLSGCSELAVSVEQVRANFERYGLLDDNVRFLVGWFKDTLPDAPIGQLAMARLDGDLYESTTDAMASLYPKLAVGGYLIVDDYGSLPPCRQAINDYRARHHITEPITWIDWTGVHWRKEGACPWSPAPLGSA